ncbi:MAG: phospho-N-acetylmuramoyl-pentapeptide-transferase [Patescibacteria group bacterium]|nr:phospho-N-acetylmuramoyl-pentapeptide-transferase [Patescibacteria group bacterium]
MISQSIKILILAGISFLTALAFIPLLIKFLDKFHLHKQIRSQASAPVYYSLHKHKENTPNGGGIIIWSTVLLIALFILLLSDLFGGVFSYLNFVDRAQTYLPLAAMLIAAILGLADDALGALRIGPNGGGLKVSQKIIVYTILAAIGGFWFYYRLGWDFLYIPFVGNIYVGWWYIPIFMFIIIASAFSANETDGLDGLAGGVMLFAFGSLAAIAFILGKYDLAAFSATVIGALLAFLWFNIYPARFFMGDTGSMALGITMGVIVMLTNTALFLPFFGFILVVESLSVIVQMTSKRLFKKKVFISTPIHHHFEAIGWHETKITMRFWIVSVVFCALGLILFLMSKFLFLIK